MLHIKDVEKRLNEFSEPTFVTDVRKHITDSFKDLEFLEGPHKYYVYRSNGNTYELPSVSAITHQFQPFVDWDENCKKTALKRGLTYEELKRQWRETNLLGTSNGTLTHLFGEACMYFVMGRPDLMPEKIRRYQYEDGFLIPYGAKEKAIASFYEDMLKTPNIYPVMPETQVYIKEDMGLSHPYAGTFDMLFAFKLKNGDFKLAIFDWKTNEKLYNEFSQKNNNMLNYPFNDLVCESKSLYTLQLSAYQLAIEQIGVEVIDRRIVWLKKDETYEKIPVIDVSNKLKDALK